MRTERDLLESLIFPSAALVRSYEPVEVVTTAGEVHSGILRKDAQDEIVLATGAETEVRIARSSIASFGPGSVSVMPQGLDQQLTPQEAKTIVTRMSRDSKLVMIGDPAQIDNPYVDSRSNGLVYTRNRLKGQPFVAHIALNRGERSELADAGARLM